MRWLVETGVFDDTEPRLIKKLKELDIEVHTTGYIPHSKEAPEQVKALHSGIDLIYYGSLNFAQQVDREEFVPGVFGPIEKFNCDHYYPAFGDNLLNADYTMLPYGDLLRRKDSLYQMHASDPSSNSCIFMRPVSGLKEFTGVPVHYNKFEDAVQLAGFYDVTPNTMCVVSSSKKIFKEWRFVVANKEIVTGSLYREGNLHDEVETFEDDPAWIYAQEMSELYNPSGAWVLDICELEDGTLKVLECGCVSFAGLYACDLEKFIIGLEVAGETERVKLLSGLVRAIDDLTAILK